MIEEPLIYLVVERIKHINSSGMNSEETDYQLNVLDYVLFDTKKSMGNHYYIESINQLTHSYLHLDPNDYQNIGIEANAWFLQLIHDYILELHNVSSYLEDKLVDLYVALEHPYCRYQLILVYLKMLDLQPEFKSDDFVNKVVQKIKTLEDLPLQDIKHEIGIIFADLR